MRDIHPETAARVARWSQDPAVLGVLLVGSRSRGHDDPTSDDDLEVLLTPAAYARIAPADCSEVRIEGEGPTRRLIWDAEYLGLEELAARVDSPLDLDHWPYERARVLFDRDGRTKAVVAALAVMHDDFRATRLQHSAIDARSAALRAARTLARGAGEAAVRMNVARAARALVRVVFALEGRWAPLDHWLEAELRTLADPTGAGPRIVEAVTGGRPAPLTAAIDALWPTLEAEGLPPPAGRSRLFIELVHPSRAAERAIHGLS